MALEAVIVSALTGVLLGGIYGLYGYATKREVGETFEPRKLFRTVAVWAIAGALVALGPNEVSEGTVGEKAAAIGAIGIFIDQLWIYVQKRR